LAKCNIIVTILHYDGEYSYEWERSIADLDSANDNIVTAASIQMRAEITSFGSDRIEGVLHSIYLESPFVFDSLLQLLDKMDEIFDVKGFPEAFLTPRTFGTSKHSIKKHEEIRDEKMSESTSKMVSPDHGGSQCTFEITVKFRQNATWQGQILWAEKNMKQNFRSVLEMLKLMDEALAESEETHETIKW